MAVLRRKFIAGVGALSIAGCVGNGTPDVRLEYTITAGTDPAAVPEDIRGSRDEGGRRRDGYQWVVVELSVTEGTLDMEDIWFRSRVETSDRFYDLDHATDDLRKGIQSRGDIQEGGEAIALYQIPDGQNSYSWNLQETRQDIDAKKV